MRTVKQDFILFILVAICSLAFLVPMFFYPEVHFGQLGKQTFAAQMIESTARGELSHGVFPLRHFVENYHEGLVSWAEEVPLYSFLAAGLVKLFQLTPIFAGKILSLLAFFASVWGFARIGEATKRSKWAFAAVAAAYPVFRLYSVQVMPDPCMTACLIWSIDSLLRNRTLRTVLFVFFASLFKYYAVFLGAGIGLYALLQKKYKLAAGLLIAVLPCFLYVAWFIHLGIPNPVIDSRLADGHGHLSSVLNILSLKNWARVGLWWFVKNASLPGTGLAAYGAFLIFKKGAPYRKLAACLLAGILAFPLIFISSFYVHDYYGLQGSVGIALLAASGLSELLDQKEPLKKYLGVSLLFLLVGFSAALVKHMGKVMPDYAILEQAVRDQKIDSSAWVLSVSGISKPVITYHLGLNAYIVGVDEWDRAGVKARIQDPRLKYALIHDFKDYAGAVDQIERDLMAVGFHRELIRLSMPETEFHLLAK